MLEIYSTHLECTVFIKHAYMTGNAPSENIKFVLCQIHVCVTA